MLRCNIMSRLPLHVSPRRIYTPPHRMAHTSIIYDLSKTMIISSWRCITSETSNKHGGRDVIGAQPREWHISLHNIEAPFIAPIEDNSWKRCM